MKKLLFIIVLILYFSKLVTGTEESAKKRIITTLKVNIISLDVELGIVILNKTNYKVSPKIWLYIIKYKFILNLIYLI